MQNSPIQSFLIRYNLQMQEFKIEQTKHQKKSVKVDDAAKGKIMQIAYCMRQ